MYIMLSRDVFSFKVLVLNKKVESSTILSGMPPYQLGIEKV